MMERATIRVEKLLGGALLPHRELRFEIGCHSCASIEGFVHGLKYEDEAQRVSAFACHGRGLGRHRCRAFERQWYLFADALTHVGTYEHYALIKRVMRGALIQNRELIPGLIETAGRFEVGEDSFPDPALRANEYCRLLNELRFELRLRWEEAGLRAERGIGMTKQYEAAHNVAVPRL